MTTATAHVGKSTEQEQGEIVQVALHCHFRHIWWAFATNSQKWTRLWLLLVPGVSLTWYSLKTMQRCKSRNEAGAVTRRKLTHTARWTVLWSYRFTANMRAHSHHSCMEEVRKTSRWQCQLRSRRKIHQVLVNWSSAKCQMPLFSNLCLVILITSLGAYPLQPEGVAFSLESFTRTNHWTAKLYCLMWLENLTNKIRQRVCLFTAWSCSQVALINPQQYLPWRITRWKKHGKTIRSDAELCWGQNDVGLIVKVFCSPEERDPKQSFQEQPNSSLKAKFAHVRYTGTRVHALMSCFLSTGYQWWWTSLEGEQELVWWSVEANCAIFGEFKFSL